MKIMPKKRERRLNEFLGLWRGFHIALKFTKNDLFWVHSSVGRSVVRACSQFTGCYNNKKFGWYKFFYKVFLHLSWIDINLYTQKSVFLSFFLRTINM